VANAWEPDRSALVGYTILDLEVAGLHSHAHTETMDREHAAFADGRFAGIRNFRPPDLREIRVSRV